MTKATQNKKGPWGGKKQQPKDAANEAFQGAIRTTTFVLIRIKKSPRCRPHTKRLKWSMKKKNRHGLATTNLLLPYHHPKASRAAPQQPQPLATPRKAQRSGPRKHGEGIAQQYAL